MPHHFLHWLWAEDSVGRQQTLVYYIYTFLCLMQTLTPDLFSTSVHSSQVTVVGVASAVEGEKVESLESVEATSSRSPNPWLMM